MDKKPISQIQLDVCGTCCPLPLIRLAQAMNALAPGQTIEITGNDPIFESSVRDFCQVNGHHVLDVKRLPAHVVGMLLRAGNKHGE